MKSESTMLRTGYRVTAMQKWEIDGGVRRAKVICDWRHYGTSQLQIPT